ncbi:hypothetical protein NKR23_g3590 [Pleurostoma richardsiae]|uniref:Single-stranded DNA-binding protein n=1 Tax=Pleurostoma richardsiae TaxID=41990 RepID=A0AA38RZ37_9PEZI|nr:hypothetical protein NKR23_g3590 [Pleurostoma richardsiae]
MSSFFARRVIVAPRSLRAFSTTATRPLAKVTIVGNLADSPELQATSTGRDIIKYSVASNSGSKENRHTSWFRVASFEPEGPRREFLQSLQKGSLVYVEGDVSINQWEDAEGNSRTSFNIIQQRIELLRRPYSQVDSSSGDQAAAGGI